MPDNSAPSLEARQCEPCHGGMAPLSSARAARLLAQVPGWAMDGQTGTIERRFQFSGFGKTMAFINALAWIAQRQGHHPDIEAGYNFCIVRFTTHAIKGLSENDFICAARTNQLLDS